MKQFVAARIQVKNDFASLLKLIFYIFFCFILFLVLFFVIYFHKNGIHLCNPGIYRFMPVILMNAN